MPPTARVSHLGSAGLTMLLAAGPVAVALSRGDTDLATPLLVVALTAGAALGWATGDPAAETLAALPVGTAVRTGLRLAGVAAVVVVVVLAVVAAVAAGPGVPPDLVDRLPEAAAAGSLAVAVGLSVLRQGERGSAPIGVTAGVLGPLLVAAVAVRWPAVLPSLAPGPAHDHWWVVTALALAVAARAGRDPSRR